MTDSKVEALKSISLFRRCSSSELHMLARNTDEVDLPAGRTLIEEGASNDTFFLLLEGSVQVRVGNDEKVLRPGDVFGEISMLDRGPATATVTTLTPVQMLVMSHAQFRDAVRAQDGIAHSVIAVMAERLRSTQRASS